MSTDYLIISPCRDESDYMERTLDSIVKQTLLPKKWVIVDDGSTDSTPQILETYSRQYDFIEVITRENRGFRQVGPGVIDAFYTGYLEAEPESFDYVCKLDLDLDLPERYFEILIHRMEESLRIATCSGKPYNEIRGRMVSEKRGDEMSVGMTKLYRRTAFEQIGGFIREVMWDAIDCHRCRQLGWLAYSWDEPELRFNHLRMMGSSQQNILVGRMRHGYGQYFMGTGLIYMTATSTFRAMQRPYLIGGLAMLWGYLQSILKNSPRLDDKDLQKFIRRFQWDCLLHGKKEATRKYDKLYADNWSLARLPLEMPLNPKTR